MPIKFRKITQGLDTPKDKRNEWDSDLDFDRTDLAKVVSVSSTETEFITDLYFEDKVAFERFRVTNSAKLTNLNNMRTANSMLAVDGVEEEVDTIP